MAEKIAAWMSDHAALAIFVWLVVTITIIVVAIHFVAKLW